MNSSAPKVEQEDVRAPLLSSSRRGPRSVDFAIADESSPAVDTPAGWKAWQQRLAFTRKVGQALSVSPETNFTHTVTLDLSVVDPPPRKSPLSASRFFAGEDEPAPGESAQRLLNFVGSLRKVAEEMEDWLLTALVAVGTAASAAWIEFVGEHLSDLRFGFCRGMVWLHRNFCCGSHVAVDVPGNRCHAAVHLNQLASAPPPHPLADGVDPFAQSSWAGRSNFPHDVFSRAPAGVDQRATWISWSAWAAEVAGSRPARLAPLASAAAYVLVGTSLACFAALLCKKIAPAAGGSGIPEIKTILGGFSLPRALHPWTLCVKVVALAMAVASGLALGKEGPMVHVGSCWAEIFSKLLAAVRRSPDAPDAARKNALLSAGSAAGVSTAFGAPVGGVLFALEEVSTYFPPSTLYKTLFCAVVASLFLKKVNPDGSSSNGTVFRLDAIAMQGRWAIVELVPFLLLSVLGGCVGALFIQVNVHVSRWRASHKTPRAAPALWSRLLRNPVSEVLLVAAAASVVNYAHPMLRQSSTFLMANLFTRCGKNSIGGAADIFKLCAPLDAGDLGRPQRFAHNTSGAMVVSLLWALVVYFLNAVLTLGLGIPAGLFVPSLTIGALIGRVVGLLTIRANGSWQFMSCQDCIHPGVYSLLGAVSVLAGVARMTVSLVVIAFEMTGGLGYIVPFMMVTLVARWTAELFIEASVYDIAIRQKRYPFLHLTPQKSDHAVAYGKRAEEIMTKDVVCIPLAQAWTVGRAWMLVKEFHYSYFPVISSMERKTLKGTVLRTKLVACLRQVEREPGVDGDSEICFEPGDALSPPNSPGSRRSSSSVYRQKRGEQVVLDLSYLVDTVPVQINPSISLTQVHHLLLQLGLSYLLFTENGVLKGMLTKKAFLSRLEKLRNTDRES